MPQEYEQINVGERTHKGKSKIRALRRDGKIPGVYYYHGEENVSLEIDKKNLYHALSTGQHVFEVTMNGETQYVMIKAVQYHPVTDEVMHVDLMRVRRSEKMTFTIPIVLEGDAIGVEEGGVLSQILTAIDINCLPTDVPESINVDISDLELNSTISIVDITDIPDDVEIVTSEESTVATITPPKEEEEPVIEEEEELAEGEESAEGEELAEGEEPAEGEEGKQEKSPKPSGDKEEKQ